MNVRVRFAPSPTGYLHVGGARTALFNWLFARHNKGQFILRIEDTDRSRSTEEAIRAIIEAMSWLGLTWEEGPYRQTDKLDRYLELAERLLAEGKAYYCYCLPEELERKRKEALAQGRPPKYDRHCLNLSDTQREKCEKEGRKPVIRFYSDDEGVTTIHDLVRGAVSFENKLLDDFIMIRQDKLPTYNFAVVVDDHDMNITHVIRGEDHLSNTPRQIQVYKALGFSPPQFAHLPMILGPDKTRLSKRHGATAIESYREEGFLPEAMINYLALLGWSYGDQTIFKVEELIEKFSLDQVSKAGAIFDYDKLKWLNSVYIKNLSNEKLAQFYRPYLAKAGFKVEEKSDKWLATLAKATKERISTLSEIPHWSDFLFKEVEYDQKAVDKVLKQEGVVEILEQVQATLAQLEVWQHEEIEETLRALVDKLQKKTKVVFQPIRVAVTGRLVSPPLFESLELLGKQETLSRLEKAQKLIQELE